MNKLRFILLTLFLLLTPSLCYANSLDEIYRDLIRSENEGYLPMFVKNRQLPDFLFEEDIPSHLKNPSKSENNEVLDFSKKRQEREEALALAGLKWQKVKEAIKSNNVSATDLEEINIKLSKNNIEAIEIYAYMNAKGVGISQNLVKAFQLYQKAIRLNIPDAKKNATLVFKSMSLEQKEELNNFEN